MDLLKYENTLPFPSGLDSMSKEKKTEMRKAYQAENRRLNELFKQDTIQEMGLSNYPKADKVFDYAWEEGHSGGLSDVLNILNDLIDILCLSPYEFEQKES